MSVEEAVKEAPQRWEAVAKSGFSAWVNWWGSGGWKEEVREGVKGLEMGGALFSALLGKGLWLGMRGIEYVCVTMKGSEWLKELGDQEIMPPVRTT